MGQVTRDCSGPALVTKQKIGRSDVQLRAEKLEWVRGKSVKVDGCTAAEKMVYRWIRAIAELMPMQTAFFGMNKHSACTWRATVLMDNKAIQEVTVRADDAWRAHQIIERQYGHIIAGPSRVFTAPHMDGSNSARSNSGRVAGAMFPVRLSAAEFVIFVLWIGAAVFFRLRGLSWLWALAPATCIFAFCIGLKRVLDELEKRTKRVIREDS